MKRKMLISLTLISMVAGQDRPAPKAPNGVEFDEFRGYETWQIIAPSSTGNALKAILGNTVMIEAYRAGFPANGQPVPDGAMMAKVEWSTKRSPESPSRRV